MMIYGVRKPAIREIIEPKLMPMLLMSVEYSSLIVTYWVEKATMIANLPLNEHH